MFAKSMAGRAGIATFTPNPAKTGPDGVATITWTLTVPANTTASNVTDSVGLVVGAPGHPLARASVEIKIRVEPAQP